MATATDKVPPVPQLVPPMRDIKGTANGVDLSALRFDNAWMQWFQQVKVKIDVINSNLFQLGNISGTGFTTRDSAGNWQQRTIQGTANKIDVANGDGDAGDPVITISATYIGQGSITTVGTITTGVWQGSEIANTYLDAAPKMTATSTSATGGSATALPAQPVGYVEIKVGGVTKKIPYYDP